MYARTSTLRPFMLLTGFLVMMASFLTASSSSHAQISCCNVTVSNTSNCIIEACIVSGATSQCFFIRSNSTATVSLICCPAVSLVTKNSCGDRVVFPEVAGDCVVTTVRDPFTNLVCCVRICYVGHCNWTIEPSPFCPVC